MNNDHPTRYRTVYTLDELRALKADTCVICGHWFIERVMICGVCEDCWVSSFIR